MAIRVEIKTARPRVTLDGVLIALSVALVITYLVAPQFVAGIIWDAALAIEGWWN